MERDGARRAPGVIAAIAVAALVACLVAGPAGAQTTEPAPGLMAQATQPPTQPAAPAAGQPPAEPPKAEEKGPNQGRISVSAGVDWTTDYYFRGIVQETKDWILQPYGEIDFKLYESTGPVTSVILALGIWNSFHGGPTGSDSSNSQPRSWYELDFFAKLSTTLFEDLTLAAIYTAYTSPNNAFKTVEEIALSLGYNDAKLLGAFALNPSLLVAFEFSGQADAGQHKGVYLQLGVAPGFTAFDLVALTFPLTVGLSLKDYYEFGTGSDSTFGYFSGGVNASVPLTFIPAAFGTWQAKGGVTVLVLGDNLKKINANDRTEVIGTLGLAFSY